MNRTIAIGLGLCVAAGCSARQRAEQHEKNAQEQVQEARDDRSQAEAKAREEIQAAREARAQAEQKAQAEMKDVAQERIKGEEKVREHMQEAAQERAKGQEQVRQDLDKAREESLKAGTERTRVGAAADSAPVAAELRDKLGNDWTVERQGVALRAVRKKATKAADDTTKKIDEEMTELRKDQHNATATYNRDKVMLQGRIDNCDDVGKVAEEFAKIDGVNQIVAELTCITK